MEDTSLVQSGILDNNGTLFDNDPMVIDYENQILDNPVLEEREFSLDPHLADCALSEDVLQLLRATEQPREPSPPSDELVWPPAFGEPTPISQDEVFFEGLNGNEMGSAEILVHVSPTPTPMVPPPSPMLPQGDILLNYGQVQGFARAAVKPEPEMAFTRAMQTANPHNLAIQQICGSSQQSNSAKETTTKVTAMKVTATKATATNGTAMNVAATNVSDAGSVAEKPKRARTAAEKKAARAERNREYARQSRLRSKLLVQSLERSVSQKRKQSTRLQKKFDNYMHRLEMVLARGGASGKDTVLQALEICRTTRRKCTWTYEKSRHGRVVIKFEGQ